MGALGIVYGHHRQTVLEQTEVYFVGIQIPINNDPFMLLLPLQLPHAGPFVASIMEKSVFDLRPSSAHPPYFSLPHSPLFPVGDFRNGLETPLNFHLNRVIISERRSFPFPGANPRGVAALMELKTFTTWPPCPAGLQAVSSMSR